jgi:sugar O-acyltransferase (sialic acid O-acetyltransferase NeuD family)
VTARIPLYVFGAGGHGKVVAEAARRSGRFDVRAFLDDDHRKRGLLWDHLPVLGGLDVVDDLAEEAEIVPAVGDNRGRGRLAEALLARGRRLATVVHPAAVVASGVCIGDGTYVGPLAVLHSDAHAGRACIVNTGAVVEHDCRLEDWVHVSPRAALGGGARVGEGAHVGLGAILLPGLVLGPWATLGAGAVMVRSLPGRVTAMGVPALVRERAGSKL